MEDTKPPSRRHDLIALLSAEEIQERVAQLAQDLSRDYASARPVLIGVLRGSFIFMADLVRRLEIDCQIDFLCVASYGESTVPGELEIVSGTCLPLAGRDVVIVEDIVDTGHTLKWLRQYLGRQARSVRVCALLDKPDRREVEVEIDYRGFVIPDYFVVGYGLDFAQSYRQLPYLARLEEEPENTE
jgi:hypoxanthine phosphoribosyltransferase